MRSWKGVKSGRRLNDCTNPSTPLRNSSQASSNVFDGGSKWNPNELRFSMTLKLRFSTTFNFVGELAIVVETENRVLLESTRLYSGWSLLSIYLLNLNLSVCGHSVHSCFYSRRTVISPPRYFVWPITVRNVAACLIMEGGGGSTPKAHVLAPSPTVDIQ